MTVSLHTPDQATPLNGHASAPVRFASPVSAMEPDWSRERCSRFWDPGRRMLRALRSYQSWRERGGVFARVMCKLRVLQHRFWSTVAGCDIPLTVQIGGGLLLPHPNGIVIHPAVVIGPNCLLFQQVTLGTTANSDDVPHLGGHVDIGAGARVLGPVRIGNHAKIGANAVVLQDVPPGATAVGIPARILAAASDHGADIRRSNGASASHSADIDS